VAEIEANGRVTDAAMTSLRAALETLVAGLAPPPADHV
jgi:hypothetical protein